MRSAILIGLIATLCAAQDGIADRERLYDHATTLLKNGDFEQAASEYENIVARWPDFFPAFSLLGVAYTQLGKLE